jgi:hypothetical protein
MKKPRKLTVTSSHHDDNLYPLINEGPGTAEQLAHSRGLLREADAEGVFEFDADYIVHFYLASLFFNLVEGPDALIELPVRNEDSETILMFQLALFLQSSGLAEQNVSSPNRIQYVATKKLLRRSSWLFARDAPGDRLLEYLSRLTLKAFRSWKRYG